MSQLYKQDLQIEVQVLFLFDAIVFFLTHRIIFFFDNFPAIFYLISFFCDNFAR